MLKLRNIQIPAFALAFIISGCGGGGGGNGQSFNASAISNGDSVKDGVFRPAQSNSQYKSVLVKCISTEQTSSPCTLGTLPFIGQASNSPTKADILSHTIVTHPWMATRFSDLLDKLPGDIFLLFRGVTGVVIGSDIRPSYYDPETGAIYLDPANLWLTLAERNTISTKEDYRDNYGNDLKFSVLWRYVKGNNYAWDYYPLDGSVTTRTINATVQPLADLLFHELAHANDFMPPALLSSVNPKNKPSEQFDAFNNKLISSDLISKLPLNSVVMAGLAEVLYQGATATTAEKSLTAYQVGQAFAGDGATATYAYSSQFEDTAMLFEEVMMKYHYDIDREEGFSNSPTGDASCNDYIVQWGQRNRIGDPQVKERAKVVVGQLLGLSNTTKYFANIPAPRYLLNGVGWCANLSVSSPVDGNRMEKTSWQTIHPADLTPPHSHRY